MAAYKDVHELLSHIQQSIAAPKESHNKFGGYSYRTAEQILRAYKALRPEGATLVLSDTMGEVAGNLVLRSTATLTYKGGSVEAKSPALHALEKKGMDAAQISGSCSSYARKYALCGLFAIDDSDGDPDTKDNHEKKPEFIPAAFRDRLKPKLEAARTWPDLSALMEEIKSNASLMPEPMLNELRTAADKRIEYFKSNDPAMQHPHEEEHVGGAFNG